MVKIIGFYSKIIIVIFFVYHCKINAEEQIFEFWLSVLEPEDARRAQPTNIEGEIEEKLDSAYFESSTEEDTDKSTKLFDIHHSPPKHYPKNSPPHFDYLLKNHVGKMDHNVSHNVDKNLITDKHQYKDNNHNTDKEDHKKYKDQKINKEEKVKEDHEMDKGHKISKYHEMDKDHTTNEGPETNKALRIDKDREKVKGHKIHKALRIDKDHEMDKDHKMNKGHQINKHHKMNKDDNGKERIHGMQKNHNMNRNTTLNKSHDIDKTFDMNKKQYSDENNKKHHKHKSKGYEPKSKDKNRNMKSDGNSDGNHHQHKIHGKEKKKNEDKIHDVGSVHKVKESHERETKLQRNRYEIENRAESRETKRISNHHPELATERIFKHMSENHYHSKLKIHKHHADDIYSTRCAPPIQEKMEEDEEQMKEDTTTKANKSPDYLNPYAIHNYMKQIISEIEKSFPEANLKVETLDRTVEYNDIVIVKITEEMSDEGNTFRADNNKYVDEGPEKKIIFIVHGLSVMGANHLSALYRLDLVRELISYYLQHLDKFDIFLMPMANPDGYAALQSIKIWNKNMSPQGECPGVNLDRNFDVAWNASRKISSCSQLYPGPFPFSEIETKAIREVFHHHGHKIQAYIHVHAGTYSHKVFKGDAVLYPRGYADLLTDDDKYIDLKGELDEAMKNASFKVLSVTVDTLFNWYGKVSGSSVDYASTVYGIPYALEFVMQLYEDEDGDYSYHKGALREIWQPIIEATFDNIWKSSQGKEVKRK